MTSSDDPPAAGRPEIWQPAALRPRTAPRKGGPSLDRPDRSDAAGGPAAVNTSAETTPPVAATQTGATPTFTGDDGMPDDVSPIGMPPSPNQAPQLDEPRSGGGSASFGAAASSVLGRPAPVGRPLAVFHELSARPARSAFGRVAAHLRGLVGSDAAPGELAQAWEQQQAPVSTGRRVWVAGSHGGAGTTTLAVCLAQELHARRLDGVALVDAAPGRVGLADRLLHPPQADVATGVRMPHERSRSLLSFAPSTEPEAAERLATDLRRVAGMTLTDGGQRLPGSHRQAEAVVVVAECSVRGIGAAGVAVEEATAAGWAPERLLLVLTKPTPTSGVSTVWAMRAVGSLGVPGMVMHHDRHLAGAATIDPGLLAPRTAVDVARIAGHVVTVAAVRPTDIEAAHPVGGEAGGPVADEAARR
ncbi:MAG: hypothetical protein ACRCY8_18360 [Dermatophilaceae bacterium]